jgi:hypothetical protein
MKEKEKRKIWIVSVRLLYCVLAVSLFGVPSPEPSSCERQTCKAVETVTEQSPVESNKVWLTEMLQRFTSLDSTVQNSCIAKKRCTEILHKRLNHTLQHLNEFIYPARARSSRLGLSFPRGDDVLLIWLLSGSYDNIEIKSNLCCSNLELSKRVPSSNPSCCLQWKCTCHRNGRGFNKLILLKVYIFFLIVSTGICRKVSCSLVGITSGNEHPAGWLFQNKGRRAKSIPEYL